MQVMRYSYLNLLMEKYLLNQYFFILKSVLGHKHYKKYAIKRSPNINEIYEIDKWARTKTLELIRRKIMKNFLYIILFLFYFFFSIKS